eukprot:scaffold30857_cov45-Phaeocystis_antarctica.AAC.3
MHRPEILVRPREREGVVARVLDQLRGELVLTGVRVAASTPGFLARVSSVVGGAIVVPDRIPQGRVHLQARELTVKREVARVGIEDASVKVVLWHTVGASERVGVVVGVVDEAQDNLRVGA